jgi:hypothetical protein
MYGMSFAYSHKDKLFFATSFAWMYFMWMRFGRRLSVRYRILGAVTQLVICIVNLGIVDVQFQFKFGGIAQVQIP